MFRSEVLKSFPPNSNPFHHDLFHMGTRLGKHLIAMHSNHDTADCEYLILVNTKTGERVKLTFENGAKEFQEGS